MDQASAIETHAIAQRVLDVLNESEGGPIGRRVDAMAFSAAWLLLSIAGTDGFDEAVSLFVIQMANVAANLGVPEAAAVNECHEALVAEVEAMRRRHA